MQFFDAHFSYSDSKKMIKKCQTKIRLKSDFFSDTKIIETTRQYHFGLKNIASMLENSTLNLLAWIHRLWTIGKMGTPTLIQKVIGAKITLILMLNKTDFYFKIQFFGIRIENNQNEIPNKAKFIFRKCRIPK